MAASRLPLSPRCTLAVGSLLVVAGLGLGGCRPQTLPPTDSVSPAPAPNAAPSPAPTPPTASLPNGLLPNSLIKEWQPLSNVLVAFGTMTITPAQVQWGSGQTSPYSLVSTEGGYLLKLEANPTFYDSPNPYIKLIPKTDPNGASTSVEVAFYTEAGQIESDEYVMYGSYFTE